MESRKIDLIRTDDLTLISADELREFGPTLVVAPHPDDESLGCGGAIALLREMSIPVTIAGMSDGTLSHPNSIEYPHARLRDLRESELIAAASILGVAGDSVEFFRYPDRGVPSAGSPQFDKAVERLTDLLAARQVSTIFVPWRRDPHPDHRAAFEIVAAASSDRHRIIEYPIWLNHLAADKDAPLSNEVEAFRIDVSSVIDKKQRAIMAHRSQTSNLINDDPDGFRLGPEILVSFAVPFEVYLRSKNKMTADKKTLTEGYFEDVYSASADPWNFETSEYEAGKYQATIAALPLSRYENALEIGCSIGVLTAKLADRCTRLTSTDVSDRALEIARKRNDDRGHVRFLRMSIPDEFPDGDFDLIVISEVGYYLDALDWGKAMEKIYDHLRSNGHIILVHWTPEVADYPQTGDEVHNRFEDFAGSRSLRNIRTQLAEAYRLDVWERTA